MYCFSFSQFILFSILKSGYQLDILFFVISLYIYCISIYYSCCFIEKHYFQSYLFDCFLTNLFHQIPFTRRISGIFSTQDAAIIGQLTVIANNMYEEMTMVQRA